MLAWELRYVLPVLNFWFCNHLVIHFCSESYEADMPVEKYAEEYNMNHNRRGKAVIFNHDEFKNKSLRPGSAVDASILEETYKVLGFEVIIHNNLRVHQIQNAITGRKCKQGALN
jgi:hypothetical protein